MVTSHGFSPFTDNGGTTLAIAGKDYCLIAGDTRQSQGYEINSRYQPHVFAMTDRAVFSGSGMYADIVEMRKQISAKMELYRHAHKQDMSVAAMAQMCQCMLYGKRFFPYYVFTILGGLDENGVGAVYSFDPVGSYERESCRAGGSAASLIQPFLDNQIKKKNLPKGTSLDVPLEEAVKIAKDAFTSATERDIHTGDFLELFIVTKDGVKVEKYPLKKD
eukprot:Partr_v1_DN23591_c0_g2_i1_m14444 putative The proteasome is a multicatalytic proteinase complex which is characterized by its ability to cleave peptides with Arg, Phe, Tyr, Leu, and Glu adjacent to the leaving group at neutral or slightly basic pH. The proteasome has an ATP-dependent proteolytic activity (By similarity)